MDPADLPSPWGLGGTLVLLVALLAFLLASFPARNSDLWMHLAAGRRLAHWESSSSAEPQSTADRRINPTWLCDLLYYGSLSALGGFGLVLVKALLVVGMALLLLRLSQASPGWCLPAVCTIMAVLAMSTRFLLQPAILSYLFLTITLWFSRNREDVPANRPPPLLPPWQLLVLFVVWVNADSWFVLGLATVALVWVGRSLDEALTGANCLTSHLRRLFSFTLLAAVCLLNPANIHAFALPPELGWFGSPGSSATLFAPGQVTSPFQRAYFANLGLSPAGLAYFPLLAMGLLSFALNLHRWHWQRFLPWLGLALLSAYQVRTLPFFAIVAGPVLAWNLQEFLAWRVDAQRRQQPPWQRGLVAGRILTVVLGVVLLVCAWTGWLQGPPFEPRRWGIEIPLSLERGAAAVHRWHQEGKLGPDTRGLHLSAETAHAFAWFCPEEKGLRLDRLAAAVLRAGGTADNWQERMRADGINHLILYDSDRGRLFMALDGLLADPEQWPLLYQEGDLAIFGWRDPLRRAQGSGVEGQAEDPFRDWQLDLNRLAYHPAEDKKAPRARPAREPEARQWWEAFWKPMPPRPLDRDEATLYLFHAEALRRDAPRRHMDAWQGSQSAGLVAATGGWMGPSGFLDAYLRLVLLQPQLPTPGSGLDALPGPDQMVLELRRRYTLERDDTPPALLFLGVRAARRALAVNPADAQAYLVLGESYLRLLHSTRERAWGKRMPEIFQLRRAEASAALNQAITLKPDLAQAHLSLGGLYQEMGYLDLALDHLHTYLELAHEAGPPKGGSAQAFREREAQYRQELSGLAKELENRGRAYEVASAGLSVLQRAALAAQKGLAGKARDLLLESDVSAFGSQGVTLELELLLGTGQTKKVREWTTPEQQTALGAPSYHWVRARTFVASGDYALAEEECVQLAQALSADEPNPGTIPLRQMMALLIGRVVLNEQPGGASVPHLLWQSVHRMEFSSQVTGLARSLKQEAEANVLRGLLALEEGETDEAEVAFRVALGLWQDEAAAASGGGLDFNGRPIAQGYLKSLE